jgi:hypothetical protein
MASRASEAVKKSRVARIASARRSAGRRGDEAMLGTSLRSRNEADGLLPPQYGPLWIFSQPLRMKLDQHRCISPSVHGGHPRAECLHGAGAQLFRTALPVIDVLGDEGTIVRGLEAAGQVVRESAAIFVRERECVEPDLIERFGHGEIYLGVFTRSRQ